LAGGGPRVRPGAEDKRRASGNALMLGALGGAGAVLERPGHLDAARATADFVLTGMRDAGGALLRTYNRGEAKLPGRLADHAFLLEALLTLYEATLDPRWYHEAVRLADVLRDRFADPERGGFFTTGSGQVNGFARRKDLDDSPIPAGGSQSISNALCGVLTELGGRIITGSRVNSLGEVQHRDCVLCDVTPRQFLALAGDRLPFGFRRSLERYRYGPGVFKVDWALREPIPWRAKECLRAATVHLGGSLEEIAASERAAAEGRPPDRPFVLLSQPTLFDPSRAPSGQHTAWAYCHVPNGWPGSALPQIEAQIERYAPGFRDCVMARRTHTTQEMQLWNENLVGGDIVGGELNVSQFATRPTWRRYRTPLKGVYLCSSSTPPGGSVHGMCGYFAAKWALKDLKILH